MQWALVVGSNLTYPKGGQVLVDQDLGNWQWQLTGSGLPDLGNEKLENPKKFPYIQKQELLK